MATMVNKCLCAQHFAESVVQKSKQLQSQAVGGETLRARPGAHLSPITQSGSPCFIQEVLRQSKQELRRLGLL